MSEKYASIIVIMDKHISLALFHIFIVVPLFFVVGFMRASAPTWLYNILFIMGAVILVYHGYKLLYRYSKGSSYSWVNALHVVAVAPLLIYIGAKQKETPRAAYELILMLAFAAFGYHVYSMVAQLQIHDATPVSAQTSNKSV